MLDFHSHILPGVDDGAKNLEESIDMLDAAGAMGITQMVATPHIKHAEYLDEYRIQIIEAYHALLPHAQERNIALHLGCELYAPLLYDMEEERLPEFCVHGTNILLIEFHPAHVPSQLNRYFDAMLCRNIRQMLAHPERYGVVQENPAILDDIVSLGVYLQINGRSLRTNPLDKTSNTAKKLLKRYPKAFLSSDAHNVDHYRELGVAQKKQGRMRRELPQ